MKKLFISKASRRTTYKRLKNHQLPDKNKKPKAGQEIVKSVDHNLTSVSVVERRFDTDRDRYSPF